MRISSASNPEHTRTKDEWHAPFQLCASPVPAHTLPHQQRLVIDTLNLRLN